MHKIVNGQVVPLTKDEETTISAEWSANQTIYDQTKYITQRLNSYPPINDQLDAIYKGMKSLSVVWPADTQAWIDKITLIKNTYPKPQ